MSEVAARHVNAKYCVDVTFRNLSSPSTSLTKFTSELLCNFGEMERSDYPDTDEELDGPQPTQEPDTYAREWTPQIAELARQLKAVYQQR